MPLPCDAIPVVVVDDDASFRLGLAENLADDGHRVSVHADPRDVPAEALATARAVVTDHQMAEVDGLTFADGVHATHPRIPVVLATAYWTVEIETEVAARPWLELCRKPLDYDEIHALLHRLAEGRPA